MCRALELAQYYRIRIEYADLGDWGESELRSEYDPQGPVIRVSRRMLRALPEAQAQKAAAFAIAHELYHHREATGEIVILPKRAAREAAANEYARSLAGD